MLFSSRGAMAAGKVRSSRLASGCFEAGAVESASRTQRSLGSWALALLLAVCSAQAGDLYVNNQTGNDRNPGSAEAPLRSGRRAIALVQPGDTVHLLPGGAVYR